MRNKTIHNFKRICSSLIMMISLAWLTVSIPFVYASQQQRAGLDTVTDISIEIEEETNPFANTTEEKTESSSNTLSEYLHDMHQHTHSVDELNRHNKCHSSDLYYAFHPELISPPPELVHS